MPDEDALLSLIQRAKFRGVQISGIREPDLEDSVTAVAIEPGISARRLCSNFPLAQKDTKETVMT